MARRGAAAPAQDCLAVCTPGLEAVTSAELDALGLRPKRPVHGGVPFRARTRELYLAELWLRTATRILVRMGSFRATTFADLEVGAARLDWDAFLPIGSSATFRVTSHRSKLYHTTAVAERLLTMTGAMPAEPVGEDADTSLPSTAPLRFVVRIADDTVTISADASGIPLYRRGWRQATAKAPLRESLAAALLLAGGWSPALPLVDPLCGSGTIAVEAATIARRLAPGRHRPHALGTWPSFEPGTWASVTGAADAEALAVGSGPPIVARDRDAGAVEATVGNAERAGVAADLDLGVAPISALPEAISELDDAPTAGTAGNGRRSGWIVTNPPWGGRVGGGDLRDLYAALGSAVRSSPGGWDAIVLVADRALAGHTGLRLHERFRTTSGGRRIVAMSTAEPPAP